MNIGKEVQFITDLIKQISKQHRYKSNIMLAEVGIHAGQDLLLHYLNFEDGQTVSTLVERMCIQHATLSTMLDRMEATGMVIKEKDADDKRISRVYITKKGKQAYKKVIETWNTLELSAISGMSKEQQNTLRTLLQQVQKNWE